MSSIAEINSISQALVDDEEYETAVSVMVKVLSENKTLLSENKTLLSSRDKVKITHPSNEGELLFANSRQRNKKEKDETVTLLEILHFCHVF